MAAIAQPTTAAPASSGKRVWAGRVISGLAVLFLLFDSVIHLLNTSQVVDAMKHLGYPTGVSPTLGVIELVCLALYLVPRTAIFGAVLFTGYLGGAIASQLRIEAPLFGFVLFPVYVAILLWGGLYLRDSRVRLLIAPR